MPTAGPSGHSVRYKDRSRPDIVSILLDHPDTQTDIKVGKDQILYITCWTIPDTQPDIYVGTVLILYAHCWTIQTLSQI